MPTPQPWAADPLVKIITNTVTQHAMIAKGDHVLAGVSGGPDSVVLVHILSALRDSLHFTLGGAYLNHGLRPAAARHEIELVSALARRLGFELHIGEIGPLSGGGSLEEQLRLQRYSFFNGTAAAHGYTKIAVGHHADDNAEAVLMRFLRGSGLLGLAGIAPVRDNIIRPLIHLRREQVLAFLKRYGVAWAEDASNADQRFVRNRVRHHLLPLLKQHYNPNIVNTLNRVAGVCLEEERHLDLSLQPLLTEAVLSAEADRLELGLAAFNRSPRPVQRRLLRMALDQWQGHIRQLGVKHVDA
ncbi:MAG: tRNA lysidine(34) synthetase TilS, partial [Desulfatitalea sp.]|nr:tRNA lysidine(34) synthetase TilS [Desulfatitalea sp.]NNJ99581.1 tRNA lysidine(34) synthetase TilS [Desulfatitalea sp.]